MPTPIENNTTALQEILNTANNLPSAGVQLPALSNPAGAENIQTGFEAVDKDGKKITGTHTEPGLSDLLPALSNPAGPEHILKGYQVIGPDGAIITGTMRLLPDGYTELAYIQSDGTQYIDTEFKPNNNTRVVMDIDILSSNGETVPIFGARDQFGSSNNSFCFWKISNTRLRTDYGTQAKPIDVTAIGRHKIDKNKDVTTVDGVAYTSTTATFQSNATLVLLSNNSLGSIDERMVHAKLYSCQVYDNGTLIRDFMPCKNSAEVRGLFDVVNSKFYPNSTPAEKTVSITATNITDYFTVSNGKYYFAGNGGVFTSNNKGVNDSNAVTTLTATQNCHVSFAYAWSSETKYDKFYLDVGGTIVVSGSSGMGSSSYAQDIAKDSEIRFEYLKDSSNHKNDDQCMFYNMSIRFPNTITNFAGSDNTA